MRAPGGLRVSAAVRAAAVRAAALGAATLAAATLGACDGDAPGEGTGGASGSGLDVVAGPGPASGGGGAGGPPTCEAQQAASVEDRAILGQAAHYPADGALRGAEGELRASVEARREVAWRIAQKVLEPVELAAPPGRAGATVPRFRTWYGRDDVARLFHHLYEGVGAERRAERGDFTDAELDEALAWNPDAVLEDPAWPEERFEAYLASLDEEAELGALGGIGRVAYSPGAVRHLLRSYPEIVACDGAPPPPAVTDAPAPGPRRAAHHAATLAACERRSFGPYFVGDGERIEARVDGTARVSLVDDEGAVRCESELGGACAAEGAGAFHVVVAAREGGDVTVDVDYLEANPAWASCLDGPYPLDAAVVKTDWRRVWPGDPLPTFDTSPEGIAAARQGDATWVATGSAEPDASTIHTVTTPAGSTFRLAGLHVMTKELDHWVWVSLFWSPAPDGALADGRPASLEGPWRNYQMCVVTSFDEPSGEATWCSNPYIELGAGNAATNCIGCHQHGGTGLTSEAVLATMPSFGVTQVRNNFPADYAWALDQGDHLLRLFADEVAWWADAEE